MRQPTWLGLRTLALCGVLLPAGVTTKAETLQTAHNQMVYGGIAVGAAIGVGLYFAFHHASSIKGCVASGPGGLSLRNEDDQRTYQLQGETGGIKAGERLRLIGKKEKRAKNASGDPSFLVKKVGSNPGACP